MICPSCGSEYIEGADTCDTCGQSVADAHVYQPATVVEKSLLRDLVRDLDPKAPIVVSPDTPVDSVLDVLVENVIGCVFVVGADGKMMGVFSERDALRRLGKDISKYNSRPISEVMTPHVNCLEETAKIAFAVRMMDHSSHRHIPVVSDQGDFQGVISARDILRFLRAKMIESAA